MTIQYLIRKETVEEGVKPTFLCYLRDNWIMWGEAKEALLLSMDDGFTLRRLFNESSPQNTYCLVKAVPSFVVKHRSSNYYYCGYNTNAIHRPTHMQWHADKSQAISYSREEAENTASMLEKLFDDSYKIEDSSIYTVIR